MLREIINFTRSLSAESFKRGLKPAQGLHVQITLSEGGEYQNHKLALFKDGDEITPFLQDCLDREINTKWVSSNKALDSRKKIHSCSPFCVAFKQKTFDEIQTRLNDYFDTAIEYCDRQEHQSWGEIFKNYCDHNLIDFLKTIIDDLEKEESKERKFKLLDSHYICVYFTNVSVQDYKEVHQKYIRRKAFNKDEYNRPVNGKIYGVSDYLTGYNQKKPFLLHQTASFELNTRVIGDDAVWLFKFAKLKENRQLPNPLPIFIDKQ